MTCYLTPIRGGMGVLTFKAVIIQPLGDFWMEATIFYKFGTTYRPWLFHVDVGKVFLYVFIELEPFR